MHEDRGAGRGPVRARGCSPSCGSRKAYLILGPWSDWGWATSTTCGGTRCTSRSAQLYVQKRRADPLPAAGTTDSRAAFIEDFLATHEQLIRSTEVLTLAGRHLERMALEKPPVGGDYVG